MPVGLTDAPSSKYANIAIGAAALGGAVGLGFYLIKSHTPCFWTNPPYAWLLSKSTNKVDELSDGSFTAPPSEGRSGGGLSLLPSTYPWCKKEDGLENCHGLQVSDPWKWMEDLSDPEAAAFAEAQTTLTESVLNDCESFPQLKGLMTTMDDYPKCSCPVMAGEDFVYHLNNPGSMKRADNSLYVQKGLEGRKIKVLDHDTWNIEEGAVVNRVSFCRDGSILAYTTVRSNSMFESIRMLRLPATGEAPSEQDLDTMHLKEKLVLVRDSHIAWTKDAKGFFYSCYTMSEQDALNGLAPKDPKNHRVCYHRVGTPQFNDVVLFAIPQHPTWLVNAHISDEDDYLFIHAYRGKNSGNLVYFLELDAFKDADGDLKLDAFDCKTQNPFIELVSKATAVFDFVGCSQRVATYRTSQLAQNCRVVRIKLDKPYNVSKWDEIVPEHATDVLEWVSRAKGDKLILCYIRNYAHVLEIRDSLEGSLICTQAFGSFGSIGTYFASPRYSDVFFTYSSATEPSKTYHWNLDSMKLTVHNQATVPGYDSTEIETKQVFSPSTNGSYAPMFIMHKKGLQVSADTATLLECHGGMNETILPHFSLSKISFILGYDGIYASTFLPKRHYGERKPVNFSNNNRLKAECCHLVSCATHLIDARYTSADKLAVEGSFHGGLIACACALQRPDLFACVLAEDAILDLLRFHVMPFGSILTDIYGNPSDRRDFLGLFKNSPLHNIQVPTGAPKQFPAFLLTTSSRAYRVDHAHTLKFIAALQDTFTADERDVQRNPICATFSKRVDSHLWCSTWERVEASAEKYAYVATVLRARWILDF